MRPLRTIVRGSLAGGLATGAMTAFMFAVWNKPLMGQKPPEEITARLLRRSGIHPSKGEQDAAASLLHLGFGMGAGAGFALFRASLSLPLPGVVQGLAFGTLVWAASYQGFIPMLRLMPPADRDRPGRPLAMLAAHWVYGATLALLLGGSPATAKQPLPAAR